MRIRLTSAFLVPLFAFCPLFLSRAAGGEFPEPAFPKGMGVTLTIPSTARLLTAIDAGVAASTVDTRHPVPAGFIHDWVRAKLPFLAPEGGMDWEIHLFAPPVLNQAALIMHVVIVANTSLDEFTRSLETVGATFSPGSGGNLKMGGPGFPPYVVRDAGDGMILLAMDPGVLLSPLSSLMKKGWRPARWTDTDDVIGFAVDNPGKWLFSGAFLGDRLSAVRRWLAREPAAPALDGVDKKVLSALLDVSAAAVPTLKEELAGIGRLSLGLRLDGGRLAGSLAVKSEPGTLLGRMAESASARGNLQNGLERKVDAGSIQLLSAAAWEDMLPGSGQLLLECAEKLADAAYPAQKEALAACVRRFLAGRPGESVSGGHYRGGSISGINLLAAEDPGALFDAHTELVDVMNGMYKATFPGYSDAAIVRMEETAVPGGARCRKIIWDGDFMEKYWRFNNELMAVLSGYAPKSLPVPPVLPTLTASLVAVGDGFLAVANGEDAEKNLDAVLHGGDAEPAFVDSPAASQALADLARRQNAVILIDYDFVVELMISNGLLGAPGNSGAQPSPDRMAEIRAELEPKLRKTSSLAGMALGGAGGCLVADFFVPTDTISVFIHNVTLVREAGLGGV